MANTLPFNYGAIVEVKTIRGTYYRGKFACVEGDFLILKYEYIFAGEEGSRTGQGEHHVRINEIEGSRYIQRNMLGSQRKPLTKEELNKYGISEKFTEYNSAGFCFGDGCKIPSAKAMCADKE